MKNNLVRLLLTLTVLMFLKSSMRAQTINWLAASQPQKSILFANTGIDHGSFFKLGYAYKLKTCDPIYLSTAISVPFGSDFMDDYKFELAGQMPIFSWFAFRSSIRVHSFVRNHQNNDVRLFDLGSGLALTNGFYCDTGHLALELGIQHTGFTRLRRSNTEEQEQSQWFKGASSQLFIGLQGSKSLCQSTIVTFNLGAFAVPGKNQSSSLPFYFQLGLNKKI